MTDIPQNNPIDYNTMSSRGGQTRLKPEDVRNNNLKNFKFEKATGGTLILGGINDKSGLMQIKDQNGNVIVQGDNLGSHYYSTAGKELVKIDSSGFHGFVNGIEKIAILPNGAFGYGTNYTSWNFTDVPGGQIKGSMGYNTSSSPASFTIIGTNADLLCGTLGSNDAYYSSNRDIFILSGIGGSGGIYLKDSSNMSPNQFSISAPSSIGEDGFGSTVINCGSSTKTAIVETSKGYNALYCNESPEVWFMDFCKSKEKIDPMFLEVTVPPYHFIKCEEGEYQVWGKRKGCEKNRFESKTKKEFEENNKFWSTPQRNSKI